MNIDLNSLTQQELIEYIQNKEKTYNEQVKLMEEELKKVKKQKKYGLVWEDHPETSLLQTAIPLLKERTDLSLIKEEKNLNHMLIEGDNYHSLKSLLYTHKGLIDVIYIDPPYNTGNKDFVYNDSFVDVEDGFRHSKWLSFMEKRLKLAHQLLSDDGVIFISIDDNEQAQLKLLCDDVFGEKNFLSTIHWRKNRKPHNAGNTMSISYEFIHVYFKKNRKKLIQEFSKMKEDNHGEYAEYPIIQADKKERIYIFKSGIKVMCNSLMKGLSNTANTFENNIEILDEPIVINNILQNNIRIKGRFRLTNEGKDEKLNKAMNENRIFFNKNGIPKEKRYRTDNDKKVDTNHWDIENGKNEDGNEDIKNIFGLSLNKLFSYPKPKNLIKKILFSSDKKNAIVLDFFAGSGTTGHAVMELNQEDGGQRQFILCTNNEVSTDKEIEFLISKGFISSKKEFKDFKLTEEYQQFVDSDDYQLLGIARQVTYERLKRVMEGYTTPNGKEVAGLEGNNLHYYQTNAFSDTSRKITDEEVYQLRDLVTDLFKIKHNTYTTVYEKDLYSVYENENNRLGILKSEYELDEMLEDLNKLDGKPIHLYLFTWSDEEYETLLNELHEKLTIPFTTEQMPKKILEFYRTHR